MSWHETEDNSGQYELNNIWSVGKNLACIQMAVRCLYNRFCPSLFTDRDPVVRAGHRHSSLSPRLLVHCSRLSRLLDCSWTSLRTAALGQDLGLEPCPIKNVLFSAEISLPVRLWEGILQTDKSSWRKLMGSQDQLVAIIMNLYPKLKHLLEKPSWARTPAGSKWFFCSLRQPSLMKKAKKEQKSLCCPFQWSLMPPW